jgi:hypothetical protein
LFSKTSGPRVLGVYAQTVARPRIRALASAIMLLTAACFDQGVGPLTVDMVNNAVEQNFGGDDAVCYSPLPTG